MSNKKRNEIVNYSKEPEYITQIPLWKDYDIGGHDYDKTKSIYEKKKEKMSNIHIWGMMCIFPVSILILIILFFTNSEFHDLFFNTNILNIVLVLGVFLLVTGLTLYLVWFFPSLLITFFYEDWVDKKFKYMLDYEKDSKAYEYWQYRNKMDFWINLRGIDFEKELAKLFKLAGYSVILTKGSGDEGIDIELRRDGKYTIVQCKAHKKPVGPSCARELYGTLVSSRADEAILASINGFTSGVNIFVFDKKIQLWDVHDIIRFKESLKSPLLKR